jgi:hypothetical protein
MSGPSESKVIKRGEYGASRQHRLTSRDVHGWDSRQEPPGMITSAVISDVGRYIPRR